MLACTWGALGRHKGNGSKAQKSTFLAPPKKYVEKAASSLLPFILTGSYDQE
jgi:hypothetical protein